ARKEGFDEFAEGLARKVTDGAAKVWICVDPDVLNVGSNPDFGDEPLGPTNEEVIELFHRVGKHAGRKGFGGISFGAVPFTATSLHYVCYYFILYTLAGVAIVEELRGAIRNTAPGLYETVAQWLRRAHVSEPVELLLTAIAQGTPASPLRVADAQELNVELSWGKGFRKITGGNDRLPR